MEIGKKKDLLPIRHGKLLGDQVIGFFAPKPPGITTSAAAYCRIFIGILNGISKLSKAAAGKMISHYDSLVTSIHYR